MEKQRKALTIGLSIIGGTALIGFIIGSFLDQQIATSLGNYNSVFGILLTMLAPVLSLAVGEVAGAILFFMPKIENKTWDTIFRVIGGVAFLSFSVFAIKEGKEYANFPIMSEYSTVYKVLAITLVVILDIGIILFVKSAMKNMDSKRIIPTIAVIFAIFLTWVLVSESIKHLASRPRPRNVYIEQIVEYRNWFAFRPFFCLLPDYGDCKSFVSGHTFISACLIGSIPLLHSLSKEKSGIKMTIADIVVAGVFTFVVAFSRIVAYAHFMTDVMGAIIASCGAQIAILNIAPSVYKKIEEKLANKQK